MKIELFSEKITRLIKAGTFWKTQFSDIPKEDERELKKIFSEVFNIHAKKEDKNG
jgi:hypothetical protein